MGNVNRGEFKAAAGSDFLVFPAMRKNLLAPAPARWHLGILWAGAGGATFGGVGIGVGTTMSGGAGAVVGGSGEVAGANAGTTSVSFASAGATV